MNTICDCGECEECRARTVDSLRAQLTALLAAIEPTDANAEALKEVFRDFDTLRAKRLYRFIAARAKGTP